MDRELLDALYAARKAAELHAGQAWAEAVGELRRELVDVPTQAWLSQKSCGA
jgi:hypothetical protein